MTQVTDSNGGYTLSTYTAGTVNNRNVLDTLITGGGKRTNVETNELGQVTSVCEVSSQIGSRACGQAVAQTGFLTSYTYDTLGNLLSITQGSRTRSFTYDALSRMLTETHPESGQTQYAYDTHGGVTSNGDLIWTATAYGNVIYYFHDALHRVTDTQGYHNGDGIYKCDRFRYDNQSNGIGTPPGAMTYVLGRLVNAETDNCNGGGTITNEWFSYSKRGELTDLYESTPHSNGYYHTTVGYFEDGGLKTFGGLIGNATYGIGAFATTEAECGYAAAA